MSEEDPFEFIEEFERIREGYDAEDLLMDEEYDLLGEAVGAIRAFESDASDLKNTDLGDRDTNQVMSTGIGWVEAYAAHDAIEELVESGAISDKIVYGVMSDNENYSLGRNGQATVDRASDILTDIEETSYNYTRGEAAAKAVTQSMRVDGESPTPADIARDRAQDQGYGEFLEYLDGLEEEMHDNYGELTEHLREVAEEELGPPESGS